MKAIAIDFDGCICTNAFPNIGAPNRSVIDKAIAEQAAGAGLILWTCREGELLQQRWMPVPNGDYTLMRSTKASPPGLPPLAPAPERLEHPSIGMTMPWLSVTVRCNYENP